ncbi:Cytochrome P450 77A2-like protein [Drosera capensis]
MSVPTLPEIVTLCTEFLNGGTDTTVTAMEWAIARLIDSPEIQSKIYEEIRPTVGPRKVEEADVDGMPYLQAFCKELLRKHPPTHFSSPHAVTEPSTLAGYDILTNFSVEFFLWGISEDPKLWSNPERFDPERFLRGGEDKDITGATNVKMIPFGMGRRICPGLNMAMFEWSGYPEGSKVDFSEKSLTFTVTMKNPLRAKVKPRVYPGA